MPDASKSTKTNSPAKTSRRHWWTRLIDYVKRKRIERKAKKQKEQPVEKASRRTMNATIWIAFFTAVLAIVGYLQYSDAHIAAETGVLNTRAWINVSATGFGYTTNGPHASGRVVIMNAGPTPAYKVHVWRCAQIRAEEPVVGREQPAGNGVCLSVDIGTVGKDTTVTFNGYDSQTIPKDSLSGDGGRFYFWGRITYTTYSHDGTKFTNFCLKNGSGSDQLAPCTNGNDAD